MYKLVADSCCDIPATLMEQTDISLVPLHISVGEKTYVDNGSIDCTELVRAMKACPAPPTTACPSPGDFADAMSGDRDVFAITMSRHVSGTYQSAVMGSQLKSGSGRVHVFDSKSASVGQSLVAHEIGRLIAQHLPYEDIVEKTEAFIDSMSTFFVLESLDNLIKNGRMSRLVGQVASILNMRPIMGATDGKIVLIEKARGTKNAMSRLAENILRKVPALSSRPQRDTLFISHCNCLDRAQALKDEILARSAQIKEVSIVKTGGLSTTYANDGGIIVAY